MSNNGTVIQCSSCVGSTPAEIIANHRKQSALIAQQAVERANAIRADIERRNQWNNQQMLITQQNVQNQLANLRNIGQNIYRPIVYYPNIPTMPTYYYYHF